MAKETKNIITYESCKEQLTKAARSGLMHDLILLAIVLLICVPIIILSIYLATYILLLGIAFALPCAIASVFFICETVRRILRLRLLAHGGFSVVKDTVYRVSRDEAPKNYTEGRHTVNAIYFTNYGRCTAFGTPFDLAAVGDEFYLVVLHNKKKEVAFAVHTMMYEYKETEKE